MRIVALLALTISCFLSFRVAGAAPQDLSQSAEVCDSLLRKNVKLSIVVPIYRDLRNMIVLIESLLKQENAGFDSFEMVAIVNNSKAIAQDSSSVIRQENQNTISILRFIAGQAPLPPAVLAGLIEREKSIVSEARTKGLRITVLDYSTQGVETNMGFIRSLGIENVAAQFQEPAHIVSWMDADSSVPPKYVSTLMHEFNSLGLKAAFMPLRWRIHGGTSRAHYRTTLHDRMAWAHWAFQVAFGRIFFGGLEFVNGPSISATLDSMTHLLRQLKKTEIAEDSIAARELSGFCCSGDRAGFSFKVIHSIPIVSVDRARKDSFAGAGRNAGIQNNDGLDYEATLHRKYCLNPAHDLFVFTKKAVRNGDLEKLREFVGDTNDDQPETWDDFMMRFLRRHLSGAERQQLDSLVQQRSDSHLEQVQHLDQAVRELIAGDRHSFASSHHEFLEDNIWLEPWIQQQLQDGVSPASIMKQLHSEFSEWFLPLNRTKFMKAIVQYQVLAQILHEALDESGLFPSMSRILQVLSGVVQL